MNSIKNMTDHRDSYIVGEPPKWKGLVIDSTHVSTLQSDILQNLGTKKNSFEGPESITAPKSHLKLGAGSRHMQLGTGARSQHLSSILWYLVPPRSITNHRLKLDSSRLVRDAS